MHSLLSLIFLFSLQSQAQTSKPTQSVNISNWQVSPLTSAPSSDTGQSALPVRIISQLGAGAGGSSASQVSILNFPAIQSVSFTTPLSVTGSFYQTTQPVSIASAVSTNVQNFPASFAVNNFPASQTVAGSVSVSNFPSLFSVSNFPSTQAVSGTLTCNAGTGTLAVSGPLTDAQLRASAVPVSGTFWPATQPISATALPLPTNAMQDHTTAASYASIRLSDGTSFFKPTTPSDTQPISGSVSVSNFPASQAVTGTFWQATQPVSIAAMPTTAVTGTFWQATQPISGTVTANIGTSGSLALDATLTGGTQKTKIVDASGSVLTSTLNSAKQSLDVNVSNASVATSVSNFPAIQNVSYASTSTVPVTGTFWQATQPVSGTFWQSTQPVSIASMPSTPVTGTFWQSTQPVSIAGSVSTSVSNFPAIQNVSYASTATIPVTGTFWQSTQPVSIAGTVATSNTQLPSALGAKTIATSMGVNIASDQIVSVSYNSTATVPVTQSGTWTVTSKLQDNAGTAITVGQKTMASSVPVALASDQGPITASLTSSSLVVGSVSIGSSTGKALAMKTGALASSAVTADQVVLTYTVTTGKTFYLEYFDITSRLTTFAATATLFGACSLESPAATKLYTQTLAGTGYNAIPVFQQFSEPLPIAAGVVIRIVCTPSAATAMTWQANFGGYEK